MTRMTLEGMAKLCRITVTELKANRYDSIMDSLRERQAARQALIDAKSAGYRDPADYLPLTIRLERAEEDWELLYDELVGWLQQETP